MAVEDIKDRESLEAWLDQRPADDVRIFAERAALRVGAIWFNAVDASWARKRDVTALPILRCLLTSGVARERPTPEVRAAARAANAAHAAANTANTAATAAHAANTAAHAAARAVHAADAGGRAVANVTFWDSVRADCAVLEGGNNLDAAALWRIEPDWFRQIWPKVRVRWTAPASPYAFWARWYDGMIKGERMPLPLLHDIALIDNAEWEAGPERIAELIAGLEELHDLRTQVKDLKAQFPQAEILEAAGGATPEHRAHNRPPELIEPVAEMKGQLTLIWVELDHADQELSKPKPDTLVLRRIGGRLLAATKALLGYCAGLGDKSLQAAADELGTQTAKWIVRLGAGSISSYAVLKFAEKLAHLAP